MKNHPMDSVVEAMLYQPLVLDIEYLLLVAVSTGASLLIVFGMHNRQ